MSEPGTVVSGALEPVISGYHPDPSICWTGAEYLVAHSSFELSPGVPLWRSTDLTAWEQVGNVLTRDDQLTADAAGPNMGVYAPTLRWHGGRLWLITTDASSPTPGQLVVSAPGPEGPWSAATTIAGLQGIDPDLAWDDDGTCYVTFCSSDPAVPGIAQARVDLDRGVALEQPRRLWSGTGAANPEAPHLYRRDGWWYLVIAEGGTERGHGVSVARSRRPEGPFEPGPDNPVLTRRSSSHPVQNAGHADLVRTPAGEWAMLYLGVRPRGATPHFHVNGRETFLAGVDWVDGWPRVDTERFAFPLPDHGFVDRFETPELHPRWVSPGQRLDAFVAPDPTGGVALVPDDGTAACVSSLSTRPRDLCWTAEADVLATEHARLRLRLDERHWYEIGVDGGRVGWEAKVGDLGAAGTDPEGLTGEALTLVVRAEAAHPHAGPDVVVLGVRDAAGERVLARLDGRYLSTEVAGGFGGRIVGVRSARGVSRLREFRYRPGR